MTKEPVVAGTVAGAVTAAMTGDTIQIAISLVVGVISTLIARGIFTTREGRRSRDKPPVTENLYLTAAAVIVTAVTIWDRQTGLATSTMIGFGVGLSISTILDVFGEKARQLFGWRPRPMPGVGADPVQKDEPGRSEDEIKEL